MPVNGKCGLLKGEVPAKTGPVSELVYEASILPSNRLLGTMVSGAGGR